MDDKLTFEEFLGSFFQIFTQIRGEDFLTYLNRSNDQRSGDEASVVDTAIISPLLSLLGFEPSERVYNQQKQEGNRPDFAPSDAVYGTCFIVEDKSTSLDLTLDVNDASSHLTQLSGYMRGIRYGWLTNGRQFTAWQFDQLNQPRQIINLDIPSAIKQWNQNGRESLSDSTLQSIETIFDLFHKNSFTSPERLEQNLALDEAEWKGQALPLGEGNGNENLLVEALQSLVLELQRQARRILDECLTDYDEYLSKANYLTDHATETAEEELNLLREQRVLQKLNEIKSLVGLTSEELATIEAMLLRLEQDPRAFLSPKQLSTEVFQVLTQAFQRKHANKKKSPKPPTSLEKDYTPFYDVLLPYTNKVFAWHQRQATLRQTYQKAISIHDDYTVWTALVQETMLGGLAESQRRDEFALQAAYVVFIRLLLIRVCEDKGVFPHRFVSDGGVKEWQKNIERYWVFATGNPYSPLLDMAYNNAQNIYAHFFTGRELFNWFELDRRQLILTLEKLSRFNFAGVDSDIVGTVYTTYVSRKEKKEKGQYYTPTEIVNYILDQVGYQQGAAIVGTNKRLIDPACGSGSFLVAAAKRLVATYQGNMDQVEDPVTVIERVRNNLFGFDLNPFACYLAEVNVLIQILDLVKLAHDRGQYPKIERFHIYNVDALARPSGTYRYALFNTLIAAESDQVDQIKSRSSNTPYANGFAFVVANPPYGASLSNEYKEILRSDYADVFYGQPDTYVFFMKLGLELLSNNGKLGFITPNTYLMGTNTAILRKEILEAACLNEIVDLPQNIWSDAMVDCALLFLTQESDENRRKENPIIVNILGLKDSLEKLIARSWSETIIQQQSRWLANPNYEMNIRYDALMERIEEACKISINSNGKSTKVLRLGDITESSQGIIPYKTKAQGEANLYIKTRRNIPSGETDWKPLLDSSSFVGRYELRWGKIKPYLKYGEWLQRPREEKYFNSPKLLVQDMRNRSLKRRLVATFDNYNFYNRHNFNNIIQESEHYQLKYILALFNSLLLNYWYKRKYDNVHINPSYFRQLPIYPADTETQAELIELVDQILAKNVQLNEFREQGYEIRKQRNGNILISIPYDHLLTEIQQTNPNYSTLTLFEAKTINQLTIPDTCDLNVTLTSNIHIPERHPNSIVLRHNKLWIVIENALLRQYLHGYLQSPQWHGKTWDEIKNQVMIPEDQTALQIFFDEVEKKQTEIEILLGQVAEIDREIDEKVLDLYGITDPVERQRIFGTMDLDEDDETE